MHRPPAPDRERVAALAELAGALDRQSGSLALGEYVNRVASLGALDFERRAPTAAGYRRLLEHTPRGDSLNRALDAQPANDAIADIVMEAMSQLDAIPEHLDEYRALIRRTGDDPWFDIIAVRSAARLDERRGKPAWAASILRNAQARCTERGLVYQCLELANDLGRLYQELHRIHPALNVYRAAVQAARSAGDPQQLRLLLLRLADVSRQQSWPAMARVFEGEALAMADRQTGPE